MSIQRRFIPGNEWLFYKIYTGIAIQDKLLLNEIYSVVGHLYEQQVIDKFFFIRYSDQEGPHLRLRFHLPEIKRMGEPIGLMSAALKEYVENRIVSKICLDTYVREIERYGADYIEQVETVFSVNSWAILNLSRQHFQQEDELWLAGIKLADDLLEDMAFDMGRKIEIYKMLYESFWKNQSVNTITNAALSMKYRTNTGKINTRFPIPLNYELTPVSPHVTRDKQRAALAGVLSGTKASVDKIVCSSIHMLYNRLFSTNQNANERVIYYMMLKYYKSRAVQDLNKVQSRTNDQAS